MNQRLRIGEVVEDNLSILYSHLQQNVLTNEQASWLLDHYPRVNKIHMEVIRTETYDVESVVEAANRLQRKTELVRILPDMTAIFSNLLIPRVHASSGKNGFVFVSFEVNQFAWK